MKKTKRIHPLWKEWSAYGKEAGVRQLVGKYQYIFSSDKGKISCVKFLDYFMDGEDFYEIYCIEGRLFEDVERYKTFYKVVNRCKELL